MTMESYHYLIKFVVSIQYTLTDYYLIITIHYNTMMNIEHSY